MKKRKLNIKRVLLCIVLPIILILTTSILVFANSKLETKEDNNTVNITQETVVQNEEIIEEIAEPIVEQEVKIEKTIIYTTTGVNLREQPSLDGKIIKVLPINTELTKIGEENGWTKVEVGENIYYIKTEYTSPNKTEIQVSTRHMEKSRPVEQNNNGNYLGKYKLTAYCGCAKCCGKTNCITASGTKATAGRTIAAPSNLKFGTKVTINGHIYTVEDRGGAIKGNKIDIYFNSHSEALAFGVRYADVYIAE